jgi:hypothetical protein
VNRRHHTLLAPLIAVLALLLGLAGVASAAFNAAATDPHYGIFLPQLSEAPARMPLEIADPTRENGVWLYDSTLGVPVYVNQNPWTMFDPEGLFLLESIDQGIRGVEKWVDNVTDGAGTKTVNAIGSFFVPDPEAIAEDVKSFRDADGKGKLLAAVPLLMESNGATRKLQKYLPRSLRKKVDKITPKKSDNPVNPTKSQKETSLAAELEATNQAAKYGNVPDPKSVGEGKDFTRATKKNILEQNKAENGGVIKSDKSGAEAVPSKQSQAGVTPPSNEAQIDHIVPKSKGGTNSPSNAQVLTREENRAKSNN